MAEGEEVIEAFPVQRTGRIQAAILTQLRDAGRWCWSADVAQALYVRLRGGDDAAPRSFDVAVRRALHTLEARGLVRTAEVSERHLQADFRKRLACWLPDQQAPPERRRPSMAEVERFILERLATDTPDDFSYQNAGPYKVARELERYRQPGDVPYSWLVGRFEKWAEKEMRWHWRRDPQWPYTMMNRAIARLEERREIVTYRYVIKGQNRRRIAWVRLANVALQ